MFRSGLHFVFNFRTLKVHWQRAVTRTGDINRGAPCAERKLKAPLRWLVLGVNVTELMDGPIAGKVSFLGFGAGAVSRED